MVYNSKLCSIIMRKSRQELKQLIILHPPILVCFCSAQFLNSYQVCDALPRECCCPQWVRLTVKAIPHRHTHINSSSSSLSSQVVLGCVNLTVKTNHPSDLAHAQVQLLCLQSRHHATCTTGLELRLTHPYVFPQSPLLHKCT